MAQDNEQFLGGAAAEKSHAVLQSVLSPLCGVGGFPPDKIQAWEPDNVSMRQCSPPSCLCPLQSPVGTSGCWDPEAVILGWGVPVSSLSHGPEKRNRQGSSRVFPNALSKRRGGIDDSLESSGVKTNWELGTI